MSHAYCATLWEKTEKVLDPTLQWDLSLQKPKKKIKNPVEAHATVFSLYVKYISLINSLDQCYDQMVQPQKRPFLRKLLDMCIGRMLELKNELVNLDFCNFNYNDYVLIQQNMTPWETEVEVPKYFIREREVEIANRKKLMAEIFDKLNAPPPSSPQPEGEEGLEDQEGLEAEKEGEKIGPEEEKTEIGGPTLPQQSKESMFKKAERKNQEEDISGVSPPVIEMTPQQRKEIRMAKLEARENEKLRIAEEKEEEWKKQAIEAIRIIQTAERGRQARSKFAMSKSLAAMRTEFERGQVELTKAEKARIEDTRKGAATLIQDVWKKHRERMKLKKREEETMLLLGMSVPSWKSSEIRDRAEHVCHLRYETQGDHLEEFLDDAKRTRERYAKWKGPWLFEEYTDEIRDWFVEWYDKAKCFPEYPTEEQGGSLLVAQKLVQTPEEYMEEKEKERVDLLRKKPKDKKKKTDKELKMEKALEKEKEKKKQEEEKRRRKKEEEDEPGFAMKDSLFLPCLEDANSNYKLTWGNRNERQNPTQKHYMDMVQAEKRSEVQLEIRKAVDELMRLELERLKQALQRDIARMKKRKKGKGEKKKKKDKKGKGKKGKGKKGKKKKKDLTGDKTTEELFTELYTNNIIRPYPEVKLSSFIGEHNYSASEFLRTGIRPLHTLGDIRNVVKQYCILPLGSPQVHQMAPLVKSVCIIGPSGSGKHLLANAICSELGAVMFDLSPENLAGKYRGKAGLQMLVHLINKMSRLLQPSVFFIDGAEKIFYKKVPKLEKYMEPKRLQTQLPKIIKGITKEDQVLVVGISSQPWAARPKPLVKAYNKFILIPRTDYGSTFSVWQKLLMQYHSVDRMFDVTTLAKVTLGLPIGAIEDVFGMVMTERRILKQTLKPLSAQELFEVVLQKKKVTKEDEAKFVDWYQKRTPLGKRLTKFMKEQEEMKAFKEKIAKSKK